MHNERFWVALAETLGPRSHRLRPLLAHFGHPKEIFAADESDLKAVLPDIGEDLLAALLQGKMLQEAERIVAWCHRNDVRILTYDSNDYPACLRVIEQPPAVLYCRGKLPRLTNRLAVGVVGTRRADAYGERVAYRLSFEMAAAGAVIVSGMAEGIDAIASIAALNAGGETIAVLGCGIDVIYPKKNTRLYKEIVERGTVLTEFAPGTPPNGWNFPIRNRIISALSGAVLVAEAGEHSGALITARYAMVQGKALFTVPGDITSPRSAGCNALLTVGAMPALDSEEMLAYFQFLYRDSIKISALPEAMQYSELTPDALRPFGLRMARADASEKPEAEQKQTNPQKEKKQHKEDAKQPTSAQAAPKPERDATMLTPRQREIFALIPSGAFSVDALVIGGIPVSEAASTLTLFEIYGLIRSVPGGMFEKQ